VFDTIVSAVERGEKVERVELEGGYLLLKNGSKILFPPLRGGGPVLVTGTLRTAVFVSPEDDSQLAVSTLGGRMISISDGERETNIREAYEKAVAAKEGEVVKLESQTEKTVRGEIFDKAAAEPVQRVFKLHGRDVEIGQVVYVVTDPVEIVAIYDADEEGNVTFVSVRPADAKNGDAEVSVVPAQMILYRPIPQATLEKCRNAAPQKRKAQYKIEMLGGTRFITEEKFTGESHLYNVLRHHGFPRSNIASVERLNATETW
jgi:hypothetical protein